MFLHFFTNARHFQSSKSWQQVGKGIPMAVRPMPEPIHEGPSLCTSERVQSVGRLTSTAWARTRTSLKTAVEHGPHAENSFLRRTTSRLHSLTDSYPLQVIAGAAIAGFAAGTLLR